MKKVKITIRTERTLTVEFNEDIVNEEYIKEWSDYFSDLSVCPDAYIQGEEDVDDIEKIYPYINLAEAIAHSVHVNEVDNYDGVPFQNIGKEELVIKKDPAIALYYSDECGVSTEYEINIKDCEFSTTDVK